MHAARHCGQAGAVVGRSPSPAPTPERGGPLSGPTEKPAHLPGVDTDVTGSSRPPEDAIGGSRSSSPAGTKTSHRLYLSVRNRSSSQSVSSTATTRPHPKTNPQSHPYGNPRLSKSTVWRHFGQEDSDSASDDGLSRSSMRHNSKSSNKFSEFIRKLSQSKTSSREEYIFPLDSQERRRIDLVHQLCLTVHSQSLYLAPLVSPRNVLDIGTGTGIWAVDFANQHPKSEVLGIDINPIELEMPCPPNLRFQNVDVDESWDFAEGKKFDYIHVRSIGLVLNHGAFFKSIFEHLTLDGFAEFQEWSLKLDSADHSLEGTELYKWNQLVMKAVRNLKKDPTHITKFKDLLSDAGFVNVVERKYAVPVNPWAPGKHSKAMGEMNKMNLLAVVEPMSMAVLPGGLGWSQSDVDELVPGVKKDLENTNIHAFMTLVTVYCQRPRDEPLAPIPQPSLEMARENLSEQMRRMTFE